MLTSAPGPGAKWTKKPIPWLGLSRAPKSQVMFPVSLCVYPSSQPHTLGWTQRWGCAAILFWEQGGLPGLLGAEFHPRAGVPESAMTWARFTARLSSHPHKMRRQRCQEPSLTAPFRRGCSEELSRSESAVLPGLAFQAGRGTIPTTPPAKTTLGIPWEPALARASWYFLLPRPDPAGC